MLMSVMVLLRALESHAAGLEVAITRKQAAASGLADGARPLPFWTLAGATGCSS